MSKNTYVVRIMATVFAEEDTEIENPKPMVLDIKVDAQDFIQAQSRVVAAIEQTANIQSYSNLTVVEDRMRQIAGLPPRNNKNFHGASVPSPPFPYGGPPPAGSAPKTAEEFDNQRRWEILAGIKPKK